MLKRVRDAITGRFTTRTHAQTHPDATVEETGRDYDDDLFQEIHEAIASVAFTTDFEVEAATREVIAVLVAHGLIR